MLKVTFEEDNEVLSLPGKIIRNEEVAGRKDLTALAIQFDDELLPLSFKMKINQYFKQLHKKYDH